MVMGRMKRTLVPLCGERPCKGLIKKKTTTTTGEYNGHDIKNIIFLFCILVYSNFLSGRHSVPGKRNFQVNRTLVMCI